MTWMKKVTQPKPGMFSNWVQPKMKRYDMGCCD